MWLLSISINFSSNNKEFEIMQCLIKIFIVYSVFFCANSNVLMLSQLSPAPSVSIGNQNENSSVLPTSSHEYGIHTTLLPVTIRSSNGSNDTELQVTNSNNRRETEKPFGIKDSWMQFLDAKYSKKNITVNRTRDENYNGVAPAAKEVIRSSKSNIKNSNTHFTKRKDVNNSLGQPSSCFYFYPLSEDFERHILNGFSPISSWNTLILGSADTISLKFFDHIKRNIPTSTLRILPILKGPFVKSPSTAEQCQLACQLNPKCESFVYLIEPLYKSGRSQPYPQGCYLKSSRTSRNLLSAPTTGIGIVGPRLCPSAETADWDDDGSPNNVDRCPLNALKSNGLCPCYFQGDGLSDMLCGWRDTRTSCFSPFRDFRKLFKASQIVGSRIGSFGIFHQVYTPERCQAECRKIKRCVVFTFSFNDGCFLFSNSIPDMTLKGLPRELVEGVVSGPAFCEALKPPNFQPAEYHCRREGVRLIGQNVWSRLLLSSIESCSKLCYYTRRCEAWSFELVINDARTQLDKYSNLLLTQSVQPGYCTIIGILVGEENIPDVISSPRNSCGSCSSDNDGDKVMDCIDYCPSDKFKVYPDECGCGRHGRPPKCVSTTTRRFLSSNVQSTNLVMRQPASIQRTSVEQTFPIFTTERSIDLAVEPPDEVIKTCYKDGRIYDIDNIKIYVLEGSNPLIGWLDRNGVIIDKGRFPRIAQDCHLNCQNHPECKYWFHNFGSLQDEADSEFEPGCFLLGSSLKDGEEPILKDSGERFVSGTKYCPGSCDDQLLNQDENMVDCGGVCPKCGTLCNDGVQNQNEDAVDCGGVCDQCSCLNNNGGCEHFCIPFDNQPQCFCKAGFQLDKSSRRCIEINECANGVPKPCQPFKCSNTIGSYECICDRRWLWQPGEKNCLSPVSGPCWARDYAIDAPIFDSSLSPIRLTAAIPVPRTVEECYEACMADRKCFVWLWAERTIESGDNSESNHSFLKIGCHLRGLGGGAHSKQLGVTSGYKFGDVEDESCKKLKPGSNTHLPRIENVRVIELSGLDIALYSDRSHYGTAVLMAWELPPTVLKFAPEIARVTIEYTNKWHRRLPLLKQSWNVSTSMWRELNGVPLERNILDVTQDDHFKTEVRRLSADVSVSSHGTFSNEDKEHINSLLKSPWSSYKHSNSMMVGRLGVETAEPLLSQSVSSCDVSDQSTSPTCLLKTWGILANTSFQLSAQLCYDDGPCGPEMITPVLNSNPILEPLSKLQLTINRDPVTSKLNAKASWEPTSFAREQDIFSALQKKTETIEIISSVVQGNLSTAEYWLESSFDEWIHINNMSRPDLENLADSNPNTMFYISPPIGPNGCDQMTSVQSIMIRFKQKKCIRSVQLDWRGLQSPQITTIEVQRNTSFDSHEIRESDWVQINEANGIILNRCDEDRTDVLDLLSNKTGFPYEEEYGVVAIRIRFANPCSRELYPNSTICPTPFVLREMRIEECQNIRQRWVLISEHTGQNEDEEQLRSLQSEPTKGGGYIPQISDDVITTFVPQITKRSTSGLSRWLGGVSSQPKTFEWTWELGHFPFDTPGTELDFTFNIVPFALRPFIRVGLNGKPTRIILQSYDITPVSTTISYHNDFIPYWFQNHSSTTPLWIQVVVGLSIAVPLACICIIFGIRYLRKKYKEQTTSSFATQLKEQIPRNGVQNDEVSRSDKTASTLSPGGTFQSILDVFSRILPTIFEDSSEGGDLSRRSMSLSSMSFASSKGWKFWDTQSSTVRKSSFNLNTSPEQAYLVSSSSSVIPTYSAPTSATTKDPKSDLFDSAFISASYYKVQSPVPTGDSSSNYIMSASNPEQQVSVISGTSPRRRNKQLQVQEVSHPRASETP